MPSIEKPFLDALVNQECQQLKETFPEYTKKIEAFRLEASTLFNEFLEHGDLLSENGVEGSSLARLCELIDTLPSFKALTPLVRREINQVRLKLGKTIMKKGVMVNFLPEEQLDVNQGQPLYTPENLPTFKHSGDTQLMTTAPQISA